MAEPIRKPAPPFSRVPEPPRARPWRVPRPIPVPDVPGPRPAAPVAAAPAEANTDLAATGRMAGEKKLRVGLQLALVLHGAVLLACALGPGTRLSPSELLLAAAVMAGGGALLALGVRWSRRS